MYTFAVNADDRENKDMILNIKESTLNGEDLQENSNVTEMGRYDQSKKETPPTPVHRQGSGSGNVFWKK